MIVIFVHGWSVTDTNTYGYLPEAIAAQAGNYGLTVDIRHIWLGKYISFNDTVNVDDIVRAFDHALHEQIPDGEKIAEFSCITHSTGGPVVREWVERYFGSNGLTDCPLRHLVMLAPANHGSPLAALGKERVGRIKAWFDGVEPGQLVLDWLSLGSQQQIDLATATLDYQPAAAGYFPFVLTGQMIDRKLYDFVNSYLTEPGSDGVVRVSGANMNYSMVKFVESGESAPLKKEYLNELFYVHLLKQEGEMQRPVNVPLGVVPRASHSGKYKGIMRSVTSEKSPKEQVKEILKCFQVSTADEYLQRGSELEILTQKTQKNKHRYITLVFIVEDDEGVPVTDFDLIVLGEKDDDPDDLAKGVFVDRQKNAAHPNHLVYYVDYNNLITKKLTGFRIIARPSRYRLVNKSGQPDDDSVFVAKPENCLSYYRPVEFRVENDAFELRPNETCYINIVLHRCVDKNVFRFDSAESPKMHKEGLILKTETRQDFRKTKPSGDGVN
ncbi:hypothetical protein VA7868_02476 [Vibrio aerogenes CECT 7868]|uniref:Phospholipase n=1 Tax=Vibrio aerogenes CECT 7868 TaxID=1216006 RepID=A0A1M5ZA05_9VIBR|nr:hypothetical protein [Vibrio aerogenes]SHI21076.1 hypothetical protein VA7868_02476 [Vibrio aerogenes CECT 7868]